MILPALRQTIAIQKATPTPTKKYCMWTIQHVQVQVINRFFKFLIFFSCGNRVSVPCVVCQKKKNKKKFKSMITSRATFSTMQTRRRKHRRSGPWTLRDQRKAMSTQVDPQAAAWLVVRCQREPHCTCIKLAHNHKVFSFFCVNRHCRTV